MPESILFVCQRPPYPPNKGEKLRTYHQLVHLKNQGHRLTVIAPVDNNDDVADLTDLSQKLDIQTQAVANTQVTARRLIALLKNRSISEATFISRALLKEVERVCEAVTFDKAVLTASSLAPLVSLMPCKVYMDFMDLDSDKWQQYADKANWPLRWVYKREAERVHQLEAHALEKSQACYLISDKEIALAKKRHHSGAIHKLKKLGNGIDPNEFYPPASRREGVLTAPKLLFVGVMDYKPNVDAVLWFAEQVWDGVKATYPNATFTIVGMKPTAAIEKLAEKDGITVTGKVDTVLPYFHDADIFVAPFRLARGVQNKLLQAFACGLPVITTPMGLEGIEGLTPDFQKPMSTAETKDEYLAKINAFSRQPDTREQLVILGIAVIQNYYSWNAMLEHFADLHVTRMTNRETIAV